MKKEIGQGVRKYPEETNTLGATTNAQKKLLANIPYTEFLHVEMSGDLRARLEKSAETREMLGRILFNTNP